MGAASPVAEKVLIGIGVSPGMALGSAQLLKTSDIRVVERTITEEEIPGEITRLEEALVATRAQIQSIQRRIAKAAGEDKARIFDAHLLVVDDRSVMDEVIRELRAQKHNVDAVLQQVVGRYADTLSHLDDEYLRERSVDIRDVTRRILSHLAGGTLASVESICEPGVVVAHDLSPSESAMLDANLVRAFVTDIGSPTSHTAIMARSLAIPAVVGMHNVSVSVHPGDTLLVDGSKGLVIINPTEDTLQRYARKQQERVTIQDRLAMLKDQPAETRDGYRVMLSANIELPREIDAVLEHGARGVGLFRSEFLYLADQALPGEAAQAAAYEEVARRLYPEPAIIRTLDLGGDKFISDLKPAGEINPFMGWRAIRFCLAQPEMFKTQLRAILRASHFDNVHIMFPLVTSADEVRQAKVLLEEAKDELRAEKAPFNENIPVGVMIEVPSAALTAAQIAPLVQFFSIGTNDLVQYTMAVDRINERIAHLYEPTHPAVIRLIDHTIRTAHEHGIWAGICGEMAGDPVLAPLLLGLDADELSCNPASVPLVKAVIRNLHYRDAQQLAEEALAADDAAAIRASCRKLVSRLAPEILELME